MLAMGGAAVIDAAKAVAAIAYADKDPKKAAKRLLAAASQPRWATCCRYCVRIYLSLLTDQFIFLFRL